MWVSKRAWDAVDARLTRLEERANDDPFSLLERTAEANFNASNLLDRMNALAARMAKRDKQLLQDLSEPNGAPVGGAQQQPTDPGHISKDDIRRIAHQRGMI